MPGASEQPRAAAGTIEAPMLRQPVPVACDEGGKKDGDMGAGPDADVRVAWSTVPRFGS
jgi:hypothetical protein